MYRYALCVCNIQLARCVLAHQGWPCEIRYAVLFTAAQSDTTLTIIMIIIYLSIQPRVMLYAPEFPLDIALDYLQ